MEARFASFLRLFGIRRGPSPFWFSFLPADWSSQGGKGGHGRVAAFGRAGDMMGARPRFPMSTAPVEPPSGASEQGRTAGWSSRRRSPPTFGAACAAPGAGEEEGLPVAATLTAPSAGTRSMHSGPSSTARWNDRGASTSAIRMARPPLENRARSLPRRGSIRSRRNSHDPPAEVSSAIPSRRRPARRAACSGSLGVQARFKMGIAAPLTRLPGSGLGPRGRLRESERTAAL